MQNKSLDILALKTLEEIATNNHKNTGWISSIYNWLASGSDETSASKLDTWRAELRTDISDDDCKETQTHTANTILKLHQYNY